MKKVKMTMEFIVPDDKVYLFKDELRKKMHKFLRSHATEVHALDLESNTVENKRGKR